jgi:magnesium transporter
VKIRLRRPRDLALALRDLARRRPREAEEYLDAHEVEWQALAAADPHDAADILEAIDEDAAVELIGELEAEHAALLLEEMQDEVAADLLEGLDAPEAADLITALATDEAADIVEHLETDARTAIFEAMDDRDVDDILDVLRYPADSAGGLMSMDATSLQVGLTAGEAIEALRRLHDHVEQMNYVFVIDTSRRLVGVVSFRELVFARPGTALDEVMVANPIAVRPETDREELAALIQRYGFIAMPVVDHRHHLLGIVTIDDVIEAVQTEATEDIAAMVGAGPEETIYTPFLESIRGRLPWTAFNVATAFLVALVVSWFEPIISRFAVLAAYMPVVASVGGNSGAQSQAIVIRAMAIDRVPAQMVRRVMARSTLIGVTNGIVIGLLSGSIAGVFTDDTRIAFVIGLATFVNLLVANLVGSGIPFLLDRLGQDPALASNIFMTLVTDLVGFGGFLAIATAFL